MNHGTTTPVEQADERWAAAHDEAIEACDEDALWSELTAVERKMFITEALLGRPTMVFADAAERIIKRRTKELHNEATVLARGKPIPFKVWHSERIESEAGV